MAECLISEAAPLLSDRTSKIINGGKRRIEARAARSEMQLG